MLLKKTSFNIWGESSQPWFILLWLLKYMDETFWGYKGQVEKYFALKNFWKHQIEMFVYAVFLNMAHSLLAIYPHHDYEWVTIIQNDEIIARPF